MQSRSTEAAGKAVGEAEQLLTGLAPELHRWISYSYQAGARHFGLAKVMEQTGRESCNPHLLLDAAANYASAARLWSPWQDKHPYLKQRVAEAIAAENRCRRSN